MSQDQIHSPANGTSSASMKRKRNSELDMFRVHMSLTDKEAVMITVDDQATSDGERMFLVVGRLLTAKPCKLEHFARTIMCYLGMYTGLEITNLPCDRILFRVFDESHKQKILDVPRFLGRSWLGRQLLVLRDVPENMNPLHVDLSWCSLYVHIHDLPLSMQTKKTALLLANKIGVFEDYDQTATRGVSVRVRVKINVDQPLMRFLKIKSSSGTCEEVVARITYEDLPVYCYLCGYLDHSRKDCELQDKFDVDKPIDELPYGSCMHEIVQKAEVFRDLEIVDYEGKWGGRPETVYHDMVGGCFERRKESNSGKMKIFLKTMAGQRLTYEVMRSEVIHHLKLRIEDRGGITTDRCILIYKGRYLEDDRNLA